MGFTRINLRPGAASHRHGGISRLTDGHRPITLRGDKTRENIIEGLTDFLRDLYRRPTRLSTLLQEGMKSEQLKFLSDTVNLDNFVMRFCPELREWLIATVGLKSTDILIDFYGLYGEPRQASEAIAKEFALGESDVTKLRFWALKQLRATENRAALKEIALTVARSVVDEKRSKTDGKLQ
jgi:hypothetical protein